MLIVEQPEGVDSAPATGSPIAQVKKVFYFICVALKFYCWDG